MIVFNYFWYVFHNHGEYTTEDQGSVMESLPHGSQIVRGFEKGLLEKELGFLKKNCKQKDKLKDDTPMT